MENPDFQNQRPKILENFWSAGARKPGENPPTRLVGDVLALRSRFGLAGFPNLRFFSAPTLGPKKLNGALRNSVGEFFFDFEKFLGK